jgi:hypothetical protein
MAQVLEHMPSNYEVLRSNSVRKKLNKIHLLTFKSILSSKMTVSCFSRKAQSRVGQIKMEIFLKKEDRRG